MLKNQRTWKVGADFLLKCNLSLLNDGSHTATSSLQLILASRILLYMWIFPGEIWTISMVVITTQS